MKNDTIKILYSEIFHISRTVSFSDFYAVSHFKLHFGGRCFFILGDL